MRTGGSAASAIEGHEVVTFGDPCPGPDCKGAGLAVHQAIIPLVDDGGDIVLPQWYALCCICHQEQYIKRYGIENLLPCGCENVDLQALARTQNADREARLAAEALIRDVELSAFREQVARDRAVRAESAQNISMVD